VKRPLVILSFDYLYQGGISSFCVNLRRGLKSVLGLPTPVISQYPVKRKFQDVEAPEYPVPESRLQREFSAWKKLQQIKNSKPLVICATWYPEAFLCYVAGLDYVVLAHGTEVMRTRNPLKRVLWEPMKKMILKNADCVIANSRFTAALVKSIEPQANVIPIPLAVDTEKFKPGDKEAAKSSLGVAGKKVISTVARVLRYKGHETVFFALNNLGEQKRQQIKYLVVGTGPHLDSLKALALQLGIQDSVEFKGSVSDEERLRIYQASDLSLLCSWEEKAQQNVEGFGLVILEAAACGAAVLGTRSGGIPDAVNEDQGGFLIPEKGVSPLTSYLTILLEDEEKIFQSGSRLTKFVRTNCTWENYARNFLKEIGYE
jgi:phosphatidyl-myo-inositol dimannoside synthase